MTSNALNFPSSEVELNVPLELQVGALLRYLDYPVCSKHPDYRSYRGWQAPLAAGEPLKVGKNTVFNRTQTVTSFKSLFHGLFGRRIETTEVYQENQIQDAGIITITKNGQILITCDNEENIHYLREVGSKIQQGLGKKVTVKLTAIHGIPSTQSLTALPVSASILSLTGIDLVDLLAQKIKSRLQNEVRVIGGGSDSVESQLKLSDNLLVELVLRSERKDLDRISISCTVFKQELVNIVREEAEGLVEMTKSKGKTLVYTIKEEF